MEIRIACSRFGHRGVSLLAGMENAAKFHEKVDFVCVCHDLRMTKGMEAYLGRYWHAAKAFHSRLLHLVARLGSDVLLMQSDEAEAAQLSQSPESPDVYATIVGTSVKASAGSREVKEILNVTLMLDAVRVNVSRGVRSSHPRTPHWMD